MTYAIDDEKVLVAIECIIQDVACKYDECLVDKFVEYLALLSNDKTIITSDEWYISVKPILTKLEEYFKLPNFAKLNRPRAFKVLDKILAPYDQIKVVNLLDLLESFWATIAPTVLNSDLPSMTVIFSTLKTIARSKEGLSWMKDKQFEPPINPDSSTDNQISDIIGLTGSYLHSCNNYHTRTQAEDLLEALIVGSCKPGPGYCQKLVASIKATISHLMLKNSTSVFTTIIRIVNSSDYDPESKNDILQALDVSTACLGTLEVLVDGSDSDLSGLCRCLALVTTDTDSEIILKLLMSANHLQGIINYTAASKFRSVHRINLIRKFLIFPLVAKSISTSSDPDIIALRGCFSFIQRSEKVFIISATDPTMTTSCLIQLESILRDQVDIFTANPELLNLSIKVLVWFVASNYESRNHYKSVMQCCEVLNLILLKNLVTDTVRLEALMESLHSIIRNIGFDQWQSKPMFVAILKVIQQTQRALNEFADTSSADKSILQAIDLARHYDDHELINEFIMFFRANQFHPKTGKIVIKHYVDLVWNHFHLKTEQTYHPELRSNLHALLGFLKHEDGPFDVEDLEKVINNIYLRSENDDHPREDDNLEPSAVIDDILNFQLLSDGIIDCY